MSVLRFIICGLLFARVRIFWTKSAMKSKKKREKTVKTHLSNEKGAITKGYLSQRSKINKSLYYKVSLGRNLMLSAIRWILGWILASFFL